jgi:hypothetical protein
LPLVDEDGRIGIAGDAVGIRGDSGTDVAVVEAESGPGEPGRRRRLPGGAWPDEQQAGTSAMSSLSHESTSRSMYSPLTMNTIYAPTNPDPTRQLAHVLRV